MGLCKGHLTGAADAEHGVKALLADGGADRADGCADDGFDLG